MGFLALSTEDQKAEGLAKMNKQNLGIINRLIEPTATLAKLTGSQNQLNKH